MAIRPSDWGPYGEPSLAILFGESNAGKTLDAVKAHPNAYCFGPRGAFDSAISTLRLGNLFIRSCSNLWEALTLLTSAINEAAQLPPEKRRPAIVLDDLTLLVKNTIILMEDSGQYISRKNGKPDVWAIYGELSRMVGRFCYYARNAGLHVVITGHESDPFVAEEDGKHWKGGLDVGSKKATKTFPFHGDIVLRARSGTSDGTTSGLPPYSGIFWSAYYECKVGDYYEKDRYTVVPSEGPMNLGEALRLAGYRLERAPGLEWLDDQVAVIVEALGSVGDGGLACSRSVDFVKERSAWMVKLLNAKVPVSTAQWIVQDAVDRIDIVRRKRAETLARLGVSVDAGTSNGTTSYSVAEVKPPPAAGLGGLGAPVGSVAPDPGLSAPSLLSLIPPAPATAKA